MDIWSHGQGQPEESRQDAICEDCKRTPIEKSDCSLDYCPFEC